MEKYDTLCILYNYKKNDIEFIKKYIKYKIRRDVLKNVKFL